MPAAGDDEITNLVADIVAGMRRSLTHYPQSHSIYPLLDIPSTCASFFSKRALLTQNPTSNSLQAGP